MASVSSTPLSCHRPQRTTTTRRRRTATTAIRWQSSSCRVIFLATVAAVTTTAFLTIISSTVHVGALQPQRLPIANPTTSSSSSTTTSSSSSSSSSKTSTALEYVLSSDSTSDSMTTTSSSSSGSSSSSSSSSRRRTSNSNENATKLNQILELQLVMEKKRPSKLGLTMMTNILPKHPRTFKLTATTTTTASTTSTATTSKSTNRRNMILPHKLSTTAPATATTTTTATATATTSPLPTTRTRTSLSQKLKSKNSSVVVVPKTKSAARLIKPITSTKQIIQNSSSSVSRTYAASTSSSVITTNIVVAHHKKQQQQQRRKQSPTSKVTGVEVVSGEKNQLLTREEEIELTQQIKNLRNAENIRDDALSQNQRLTEVEWAMACQLKSPVELRKVVRRGQEARARLVQANMGLVMSIAKRHQYTLRQATEAGNGVGTILTLQDCLQEGQIGLIAAAEKFDASRNVRFSTYATWWIRQRILRSISDSSRTIRLPAHVHSMLMKIRKAKKRMQLEIGREPSTPELAHYMEIPVEKLQQYTQSSRNVISLENPLRSTGNGKDHVDTRTLADTIASDAPTPLEDAQRHALRQDLDKLLNDALTAIERTVMTARYGLDDGRSKSLQETSQDLGLSREKVRTLEARALNKLRSPQKNYRLKTHLGDHVVVVPSDQNQKSETISTFSRRRHHHHHLHGRKTKIWNVDAAATATRTAPISADDCTTPVSPFDAASSRSSRRAERAQRDEQQQGKKGKAFFQNDRSPDRMWFF